MKTKTFPSAFVYIFASLFVAMLAGCSDDGASDAAPSDTATPLARLRLSPSADCGDYRNYIAESLIKSATVPRPIMMVPTAEASSSPDSVTSTNVREEGVDEADIVKADAAGNLYIARGRHLIVEQAFPASALGEVARLDLGMEVLGLFLDETSERIVALGYSGPPTDVGYIWEYPLVVAIVDIAQTQQPRVVSRLNFHGTWPQSRRIGNRVHVVFNRSFDTLPGLNTPEFNRLSASYRNAVRVGDSEQAAALYETIAEHVYAVVAATDESTLLLPATRDDNGVSAPINLLTCGDVQRAQVAMTAGLTAVVSFNTDGSDVAAAAVAGGGYAAYASTTNLYLTKTSGGWWWSDQQPAETAIYKIAVGDGRPVYVGAGKIDGWAYNPYQFSEHDGFLRVASSSNGKNYLTVLEDDHQGTLARVAALSGFGENETMFATRFMGTRAFIVTFRRIDPLFAFDLSDPRNPRLVGELEIPGFSTYAHVLDDSHLLTVGDSGSGSLQLQIFDVSNLAAPRLAHRYTPFGGFSGSEAGYDAHAFTFHRERGLLAIPFYSWSPSSSSSGFMALKVGAAAGIEELARVDHSTLAYDTYCVPMPTDTWRASQCTDGSYRWWAWSRRSVIMTGGGNDYLYTISDAGIQANHLNGADYPVVGRDPFGP